MSQPYIGEIRMFAGNFAPVGWMFCDGSLLAISENEALFQLIGTTYGGDGQTVFALPDMRGRFPLHQGNGYMLAQTGGEEAVTLTEQQLPVHTHQGAVWSQVSQAGGTDKSPIGRHFAASGREEFYGSTANVGMPAPVYSSTIQPGGANQPHENMPPFTSLNFIISLFGIFPSQA